MPRSATAPAFVVPIFAALGCLAALLIGGALTRPNLDWYATLEKPGFTPPNGAFPIAWTILYMLSAIAAWLVWRAPGKDEDHRLAMIWFFIQLVVGVLWSVAFFALHSPALGLGVIFGLSCRHYHYHRAVRSLEPGRSPAAHPAPALGLLRHRAQFRDSVPQ